MDATLILTIVGSLLSIAMTVNAFLLKGIMSSQNKVEVELAKLLIKVENYSTRIENLEHKFRKLEIEHVKMNREHPVDALSNNA